MWKEGHLLKMWTPCNMWKIKYYKLQVRTNAIVAFWFHLGKTRVNMEMYKGGCHKHSAGLHQQQASANNDQINEKPAGIRPNGPERCSTAAPATPLFGLRLCSGDNSGICDLCDLLDLRSLGSMGCQGWAANGRWSIHKLTRCHLTWSCSHRS